MVVTDVVGDSLANPIVIENLPFTQDYTLTGFSSGFEPTGDCIADGVSIEANVPDVVFT